MTVLSELDLLRALYTVDGVTLVCISIDEDALFSNVDLSSQTRSRLRAFEMLRLESYRHDELVDILDYRVAHGLDRSRVAHETVPYIADLAAGDAREGIALLRRAARQARSESVDITPALVDEVRDPPRQPSATGECAPWGPTSASCTR